MNTQKKKQVYNELNSDYCWLTNLYAPWCDSTRGFTSYVVSCGCNIIFSLSPSKHSSCKQGTSVGKAILPSGTTPITPTIHCYVYTPERQTCLHTDPLWAPGKTARRKNDSYWVQDCATRVIKNWSESLQGVSPPLLAQSGSSCLAHTGLGFFHNMQRIYRQKMVL